MQLKHRKWFLCFFFWRRYCETCQKWFAKFNIGEFLLIDAPKSTKPLEVDSGQIKTLLQNNQCCMTRNTINIMKTFKSSSYNHLDQLEYVTCIDIWLPFNENIVFFRQTLVSDRKWMLLITYIRNWERMYSWNKPPLTVPEAGLH